MVNAEDVVRAVPEVVQQRHEDDAEDDHAEPPVLRREERAALHKLAVHAEVVSVPEDEADERVDDDCAEPRVQLDELAERQLRVGLVKLLAVQREQLLLLALARRVHERHARAQRVE